MLAAVLIFFLFFKFIRDSFSLIYNAYTYGNICIYTNTYLNSVDFLYIIPNDQLFCMLSIRFIELSKYICDDASNLRREKYYTM